MAPPDQRIDPLAEAFAGAAETYEEARPGYPQAVFDWVWEELGLAADAPVIDLAAGTGKVTRRLVERGARVTAVEPLAGMREVLARTAPGAAIRDGTAEKMPVADGAAGAVFVGEAFHWFDGDRALLEIHRVLSPAGALVLLWNRDMWADRPWTQELYDRLDAEPHPGVRPENRPHTGLWREAFDRVPGFLPFVTHSVETRIERTPRQLAALVRSWSWVAALPPDDRDALSADVVRILAAGGSPDAPMALTYRTDVDLIRRS